MTLELQIAALKMYLNAKVAAEDWHAVSDAANDLRVLEAQKNVPMRKFHVEPGMVVREEQIDGETVITVARK